MRRSEVGVWRRPDGPARRRARRPADRHRLHAARAARRRSRPSGRRRCPRRAAGGRHRGRSGWTAARAGSPGSTRTRSPISRRHRRPRRRWCCRRRSSSRPDGTAVADPDVVDAAEVTSQDPFTVTYTLDRKASWSDGTPITAEDFSYLRDQLLVQPGTVDPAGYQLISADPVAGCRQDGRGASSPNRFRIGRRCSRRCCPAI